MPYTAFVTGVTGTQGGAVAKLLISNGWKVHALARTSGTDTVKHFDSLGVKFFSGDWDNEVALSGALQGCDAIFMSMLPSFANPSVELVQAKRILALGKTAGVKNVVCSTGIASGNPERLPNWDPELLTCKFMMSKHDIEDAVRAANFDNYTILRPGNFMANFLQPKVRMYAGLLETNKWTTALLPETKLGMIDEDDIAKFAVAALKDPGRFNGKSIELASQMLTAGEVMNGLSEATGRQMEAVFLSDQEIEPQRETNFFIWGYLAMREAGQFLDMDEIKSYGIPLNTFDGYLERQKEAVKRTYD